jgi:hypothetical protein
MADTGGEHTNCRETSADKISFGKPPLKVELCRLQCRCDAYKTQKKKLSTVTELSTTKCEFFW